jgi:outer membrane protein
LRFKRFQPFSVVSFHCRSNLAMALHLQSSPLRFLLALILGLGAAASSVQAQSLKELYEAAREFDATYLSARTSMDAATYKLDQVRALRRPTAEMLGTASYSRSRTPEASTQSATNKTYSATLRASQTLFNRANDKTVDQGKKLLDIAQADFESAEQDLIVRVSQAYFDVLAAQDALATSQASLKAISEQLASAKRNFEVGNATITDTREAQARADLGRANELQAENDLRNKRIVLDQLVGRMNVVPKQLAVPVKLPETTPNKLEEWLTRADAEHPLVRKAQLGFDVAQLETDKAKAGHLPTLAVVANAGRGFSRTTGDQAPTLFSAATDYNTASHSTTTGVALNLNVPLFAGFATQNRVKETLALEDKAQNDMAAARRGVAQATRALFLGVQSGAAQVQALEAAESSSKLALEATQLGFKVGVRVNLDVLNAQSQLFTTRSQLAKARYDLVMNSLKLRQASGRLAADDVVAINKLLQP